MTFYIVGYKLMNKSVVVKLCGNILSARFWLWYYHTFKKTDLKLFEWFTHGDDLP